MTSIGPDPAADCGAGGPGDVEEGLPFSGKDDARVGAVAQQVAQDVTPQHPLMKVPADDHPDPKPPGDVVRHEPVGETSRLSPRIESFQRPVEQVDPIEHVMQSRTDRGDVGSVAGGGRP